MSSAQGQGSVNGSMRKSFLNEVHLRPFTTTAAETVPIIHTNQVYCSKSDAQLPRVMWVIKRQADAKTPKVLGVARVPA